MKHIKKIIMILFYLVSPKTFTINYNNEYENLQLNQTITNQTEAIRTMRNMQISFLSCLFSDINGNLKEIIIPYDKIEAALEDGLFFDGSSVTGYSSINNSDLLLKLDTSSIFINPWHSELGKTAHMFCSICTADGKPYENDPRSKLQQSIEKLKKQKLEPLCGAELEFFLFKKDQHDTKIPFDQNNYCASTCNLQSSLLAKFILFALTTAGLNPEKIHHEVAPGQLEVSLRYTNALELADKILFAQYIIKLCASAHAYEVDFSPKPILTVNGSGMHIHMSLFDIENNKNAFYDQNNAYELSIQAQQFATGALNRIAELMILFNPTENSYQRLAPGFEAPVYICWGPKNRSAAIRIPDINQETLFKKNGAPIRLEFRFPDATCNPYLAITALIESGMEGIYNNYTPLNIIDKNIYKLTSDERNALSIDRLPTSLNIAYKLFNQSIFAQNILGENLYKSYKSNINNTLKNNNH